MPPTCCVPTCKITRNNFVKTSYHEIPSKEPLRAKWVRQIGTLIGAEEWEPVSESAVVCSKHFLETDFLETTLRRRLKPTAIPSVFCLLQHGKPYKRRKNSTIMCPLPPPIEKTMHDNSQVYANDAYIQSTLLEKFFLESLQENLEMMEVANHFLADCSNL